MTKTQISVRVDPATLDAIANEAARLSISRGAVIDRWLTDAAARNAPAHRRVTEELLLMASQALANAVASQPDGMTAWQEQAVASLDRVIMAIRLLAGID